MPRGSLRDQREKGETSRRPSPSSGGSPTKGSQQGGEKMATRSTSKLLRVIKTGEPGFESRFADVCDRSEAGAGLEKAEKDTRKILHRVREGGDAELLAIVMAWVTFAMMTLSISTSTRASAAHGVTLAVLAKDFSSKY